MHSNIIENANKVTYLVEQYPDKTLAELVSMLQMPSIDINTAIWYAVQVGWLSEPDKETGELSVVKKPESWNFGKNVERLMATTLYAFEKLAERETDLDEGNLSHWQNGYITHDIFVAMQLLLEQEKLAEYVIEDGENTYTFYTLYENRDKLWGRKQFKKDPLDKDADESNTHDSEEEAGHEQN